MESIIALEELIKENELKTALHKRQLADHEAGVHKLSAMSEASTENSLEIATDLVAKYKAMLAKLLEQDQIELEEKEKLVAATLRKKYFDNQISRIKLNRQQSNDKKLEAMRIIGELPSNIQFEDNELFEIATKSIELSLPELAELTEKLELIRKEFDTKIIKTEERNVQELGTINYLIPIIVLHFHILLSNIKENIDDINNKVHKEREDILNERREKKEKLLLQLIEQERIDREKSKQEELEARRVEEEKLEKEKAEQESKNTEESIENESLDENSQKDSELGHKDETADSDIVVCKEDIVDEEEFISKLTIDDVHIEEEPLPDIVNIKFAGFPRYQDWWIRELWLSHQAYIALFKWKNIINNLCRTTEQKKAWSIIFDQWVFVKKMLNDKGKLAFNYNYTFDSLLETYAELEEEIEKKNILSMEDIIKEITKKEDFTTTFTHHDTQTPYLRYKEQKKDAEKRSNKEDK